MRQTTTAEVRLDHGKAAGSGLADGQPENLAASRGGRDRISLQRYIEVRVQTQAFTQFDAKQMVELQYGNGSVIFGPARVNLMRAV